MRSELNHLKLGGFSVVSSFFLDVPLVQLSISCQSLQLSFILVLHIKEHRDYLLKELDLQLLGFILLSLIRVDF